ncbi:MAG: hypothetical protein ABI867_28065 [Kofleriaceae bacterium]
MTKWIIATIMTVGAFAASASPSQTTDAVDTGTCSYTCSSNGKTYINRTQCRAACSGTCTVEAC